MYNYNLDCLSFVAIDVVHLMVTASIVQKWRTRFLMSALSLSSACGPHRQLRHCAYGISITAIHLSSKNQVGKHTNTHARTSIRFVSMPVFKIFAVAKQKRQFRDACVNWCVCTQRSVRFLLPFEYYHRE